MNQVKYLVLILVICCQLPATSQEKVLFEVEGVPVALDEFLYIYDKTNRNEADYSRASVEEYLDLYTKFKLKVHKARAMKLDTIKALQNELAGYRKQLASAYLSDKEVLDNLTQEAFKRMQEDVDFSHVLIKINPGASEKKEEEAYIKAMEVLKRLQAGEEFSKVAREMSDDATVAKNEGRIGYITALLPDGFYDLETALYTLPKKKYSTPIRSKLGYHIVLVNNRRNARGEIEVSQILIRSKRGANAKARIDSLYQKLEQGADFAEVAKSYSEDKATAAKGGHLGFFGINKYESIFENTAFRIPQDGAYSRPIKTSIGWHIIKRHSLKPKPSFEVISRQLEAQIKKDGRFEMAEKALLNKVMEENGFEESIWDKEKFIADIGDNFLTYQWKAPNEHQEQTLAKMAGKTFTTQDLLDFMVANTATRLRLNRATAPKTALDDLYGEFIEDAVKKFEEGQLEEKFPEFKALMREYAEGILLFEATKMKVWDKASSDSSGLKAFYRSNPNQYMWPERVREEQITINTKDISLVNKVVAQLAKKPAQKVLKKFNKKSELIQIDNRIVTKEELDPNLKWTKFSMSTPQYQDNRNATVLKRVGEVLLPQRKSLEEARGFIIADYQDHLEREWVDDLKKEYQVVVHDDVLNSIIRG